jgi:hypothetical protein
VARRQFGANEGSREEHTLMKVILKKIKQLIHLLAYCLKYYTTRVTKSLS